jgi:hypothetical protein
MTDNLNKRVGYKRPPKHAQFRPGESGNPKGRPKQTRNFKTDLGDELGQHIPIREGGREMKVTKQRAFIKALVAAAIKGDMRATSALVSFCTRTLGGEEQTDAAEASTEDLDIIESFVERERQRLTKKRPTDD